MSNLSAFRLGDIRGLYPEEINEAFIRDFAHAFVGHFSAEGRIATGRDMRSSSEALQHVLNETLSLMGVDVVDMGLCATEVGYFASGLHGIGAAIIITASHNPPEYNGIKCVLGDGQAITQDNGLNSIRMLMDVHYRHLCNADSIGSVTKTPVADQYLSHLVQHFGPENLRAGRIALNGLNGTAATLAGEVADRLQLDHRWFRQEPGAIPAQGANPADPLLASEMKAFMATGDYSLGVAWDGDCDRCVFFDETGELVPAYYLVGLLADFFLELNPGAAIAYDTKLYWHTEAVIQRHGGRAIPSKTGHAFMKQSMHDSGAVYGGELSSHHYFGHFHGCDSGMCAWLTVLQLLQYRGETLQVLVDRVRSQIACTPEISLSLSDIPAALDHLRQALGSAALETGGYEGIGMTMPGDWRFSVIPSKTEPVVRLNFESRGDPATMLENGREVFALLEPWRVDNSDWQRYFRTQ